MVIEGVDYSYDRPSSAGLAAAGKRFVVRYGAVGNTGKYLTATEVTALREAGLDIVANAEETANAFRGTAAGVRHATAADAFFRNLGMPPHRPVYFSVDWDAQPSDWLAVDAALRGAASVIGAERVGVYGSYDTVAHCSSAKTASWFWQTYAWSGDRWHPTAHLRQYSNNHALAGGTVDYDQAMTSDYGQWGADVATSQNGWPVDSTGALQNRTAVQGVTFPNGIRKGDVFTVLSYVAREFHRTVEPLHAGWCWGWFVKVIASGAAEDDRPDNHPCPVAMAYQGRMAGAEDDPVAVTLATASDVSNHSSGTAIDLNAPDHPLGAANTFSTAKVTAIRKILAFCDGVVRWGGDYANRKDEMHFEIVKDASATAALAAKIRSAQEVDVSFEADQVPIHYPHEDTYTGPTALGMAKDSSQEARDLIKQLINTTALNQAALLKAITSADDGGAVIAAVQAESAKLQQAAAQDAARDAATAAAIGAAVQSLAAIQESLNAAGGDPDLAPVMAKLDGLADVIESSGRQAGQEAASAVLARLAAAQDAEAAALRTGE